MDRYDVTVLMAVYNAEVFLHESLDSLLAQTIASRVQVICVDDCSTDGSLSVLKSFAQRCDQLSVIHLNENHGQAYARNVALQKAQGRYICMLDADDSFSPDALQQAVEVMEKEKDTDCVLFEVSMDWHDHSQLYSMPDFDELRGEDAFRMSLTWQIHGLYMVRADIHRRYPYDDTCRLYSDDNTTRLHYLASRKVARCKGVYHYRQHASSATHQVSVRRYDYLRANESMKQQLLSAQVSREILSLYENHRWLNFVGVYMFHFVHSRQLSDKERNFGLNELKRVWKTIDRKLLYPETIHKLGYCPMSAWWLFRLQEWLYFTLRGLLGKNY